MSSLTISEASRTSVGVSALKVLTKDKPTTVRASDLILDSLFTVLPRSWMILYAVFVSIVVYLLVISRVNISVAVSL